MTSRFSFGLAAAIFGVAFCGAVLSRGVPNVCGSAASGNTFSALDLLPDQPGFRSASRDTPWLGMKLSSRSGFSAGLTANQSTFPAPIEAVSLGMPIAIEVLGAGGANRCAALFGLPSGLTPAAVLNQVAVVFQRLHNAEFYAEEFDPSDPGNPRAGHYTMVFNTDSGNAQGGPREAADTIVHELIHVVYGMSHGAWVGRAVELGWVNADGGDDPASQAAQARNDEIVSENCFSGEREPLGAN
jgi:hypothetical protein